MSSEGKQNQQSQTNKNPNKTKKKNPKQPTEQKQNNQPNKIFLKSHSQGLLGTIPNSKQLEVETNKMSALDRFPWLDIQR